MIVRVVLVFVLFFGMVSAESFNMFKSYANAAVKPKQYAKKERKEIDLSEYLTKRQRMMLKYRNGKDVPGAMFKENWSGFDLKDNSNPLVKRRLIDTSAASSNSTLLDLFMNIPLYFYSICVLVVSLGMLTNYVVFGQSISKSHPDKVGGHMAADIDAVSV